MAVTAEVRYRFKDVLHVAVEGRIETGRFGLSSVAVPEGVLDNSDAADGYVVDLGTVADFDVHFTYIVTGRLSASLDFKNVLASRYRTFAAYPVQGFQAFLGATYTF
jgi:outer membrane cobalamin receptor